MGVNWKWVKLKRKWTNMKKWIKHLLWTVVPFALGNLILVEYQDTIGYSSLGLIIT